MPYIVQWQVITPVKIMIKEVSTSLIFYGHENEKQLTFISFATVKLFGIRKV